MNRSDLIARMTERLGGDRASAVAAVSGVLEEIEGSVARGERVTLAGFGTFDRRARAARMGRNPRTGEAIRVDATVVPVFRAATGFKRMLTHSDGASGLVEPALATGGAQGVTGTRLQVVAAASTDTAGPAAVADADSKKKKKGKKAAKQAADKDSKKKARKAVKSKAGKKTA